MGIVEDTHHLLDGMLNGEHKQTICFSTAGGKKRYAHIERASSITGPRITVTIFGNRIIDSDPTQLILQTHSYKTDSTKDAFYSFTTINDLSTPKKNTNTVHRDTRWIAHFDGGQRLLYDGMVLNATDVWVKAADLREGDMVDLQGDVYASRMCTPECDDCENRIDNLAYEYAVVDEAHDSERGWSVFFADHESLYVPPDHLFYVHERGHIPVRQFMQGAPEVEVDSPFGPVFLQPTNGDAILVNCNSNGRFITVNKVPVSFAQHWWRMEDGTWTDVPPSKRVGTALAITRRDDFNKAASVTCYRKVREAFPTVVREWAETPIGMHWLRHAQEAAVNNRAMQIEEQINELGGQVDAKKRELADLLGKDVSEIEEALR